MNEKPPSIWKRPWNTPARALAWFALLVGGGFIIICCFALITEQGARGTELIPAALLAAVALSAVAVAGYFFVRWISSWRNLRRFLFVVVCLVTLIALAYAEENWRGKHAWQKYLSESEAKGEKFNLASLAPAPVPDEKNFALTPLLKPATDFTQGPTGVVWHDTNGLARLDKIKADLSPGRNTNDHLVLGSVEKGTLADVSACGEFYRGNTNYPQAPTTATAVETILVALGKFDPELKELREAAAARPHSRFPIHYEAEPPWGILLPHLARMKGLTTLCQMHAMAELDTGRAAEAFEDLKLGLRLSDSIRDEPLLIDHLVRIATLAIDLQTVREGLYRHAWTDGQLAELETRLASLDLMSEYQLAMRGERACEVGGLEFLRRQGFRSNPMDYLGSDEGGSSSTSTPPLNPIPSGWFYQNMLTISRMFQSFMIPIVDERAHRVFPEVAENGVRTLGKMRTGPYTIFAKLLLPALGKAMQRTARMQTYVDAANVACALERYRLANGKLPDALEALAPAFIARIPNDVIDGKALRYRVKADGGYVLYSVGWNQTDDGGELAWKERNKETPTVDFTQGDWVWLMPARKS
ncbi:MAG TPA: hypothetical protein VNZ64_12735 [Candidatus Acidoferrum sp.]|jgi:hypothetical protein|nr:hypothetical protein [Candidatus Acidoferrum sp.]